jgi:lactoylglutathione lyase
MNDFATTTSIELHVSDLETVKEFYTKLHFSIIREEPLNNGLGYLVMGLEKNVLCFWGGSAAVYDHRYFSQYARNTQRGYGVEVVLQVRDIARYYESILPVISPVQELQERPWGATDFRVVDPFGYYLRISSVHDPRVVL